MQDTILLVEDDLEIARIIQNTLAKEGYVVIWATTGLEGWEDFKNSKVDLVLVDWMLPEMDGLQLCDLIRLESDVPILMISARSEDIDKVAGLQGADDYLAKPFSLEELKARVASHLRRWKRFCLKEDLTKQIVYTHGLTIDWRKKRVLLFGKELNLTQKEFALLKLFADNPFQLFTKEALYTHVWQQIGLEDTHTVTVHIKELREKLQDPVKNPHFIQTVWGKGYRFIGEVQ